MKAVNIKWDTDGDKKLFNSLPTEIKIPEELAKKVEDLDDYCEEIEDYISNVTGFCHYGFDLVNDDVDTNFFCRDCPHYKFNARGNHGHCGWNGCRERKDFLPTKSMVKNCKYDRDDKEFWLKKIEMATN